MTRIVLCRPEGGLNDILCGISLCYSYCKTTERTLIIDTINTSFHESLGVYFVSKYNDVKFLASNLELPSAISAFPTHEARGLNYEAIYKDGLGFVDKDDDRLLRFDFSRDYPQDVLLYHNCGGGESSFGAFKFLDFQPWLKQVVKNLYERCPQPYSALHLRGTDGLGTNYSPLVSRLEAMPRQNVFLATDCIKLRDIVKDRLSKHYLFSFSAQHLASEGPVHAYKPEDTTTHN